MFHLEFVADAPDSGDGPFLMILDLFTEPFDMDIYGTGIAIYS